MEFSMQKLKEAIIVILKIMGNKASKVKLVKTLFYCDFKSYKERHIPITGDRYVHYKYGPVPSHFESALRQMQREGSLAVIPAAHTEKWEFDVLRESDRSVFDDFEIKILEETSKKFANMGAKELSEWSHLFEGWKITRDGEYINYEFIDIQDFDDEENPPQFEPIDDLEKELFDSPEFNEIIRLATEYSSR